MISVFFQDSGPKGTFVISMQCEGLRYVDLVEQGGDLDTLFAVLARGRWRLSEMIREREADGKKFEEKKS